MASFGTGVGLAQYGATLRRQAVEANTHDVSLKLPDGIKSVTTLDVKAPGFSVRYVADNGQPNARMRVVTDKNTQVPKVTMTMEGTTLKLTTDGSKLADVCYWPGCDGAQQQLIIYGPVIQTITAEEKTMLSYENAHQDKLSVTAKQDGVVTVGSGSVDTLDANAEDRAVVSASNATISHAKLNMKSDTSADLGVVQSLEVTHANSCPASSQSRIRVWNAGTIIVNNVAQPVTTAKLVCLVLTVEGGQND
jgi:hypothetical protein